MSLHDIQALKGQSSLQVEPQKDNAKITFGINTQTFSPRLAGLPWFL